MNQLQAIIEWNTDRKLDKITPLLGDIVYCKLEELFEIVGVNKAFKDEREFKALVKKYKEFILLEAKTYNVEPTVDDIIDGLCDDNVFNTGFILRLGYDPLKAMDETIKEINSRIGSFDDNDGKWIKRKDDEAKAQWYKADYSLAKL